MKHFFTALLFFSAQLLVAQTPQQQALDNLNRISAEVNVVIDAVTRYTGNLPHGQKDASYERNREGINGKIQQSINSVNALRPPRTSVALKDSALSFMKLALYITRDDYERIIKLEKASQQSYDAMRNYLQAWMAANDKLQRKAEMIMAIEKKYADTTHIAMPDPGSSMQKLTAGNAAYRYYHILFLERFKLKLLEDALKKAEAGNYINAMQAAKERVVQQAKASSAIVEKTIAFKGDGNLKQATLELMNYYTSVFDKKYTEVISFNKQRVAYESLRSAYMGKPAAQRTRAETDRYNSAVAEYDLQLARHTTAVEQFEALQRQRDLRWERLAQDFIGKHVPLTNAAHE